MSDSYVKSLNRSRNYGIDILRIISMFMVTLQHFCRQGGLAGTPDDGISFYILTAFVVICYGAVDIFALISGYVMRDKTIKYQKLVNLWIQVFFYSVSLSVIEIFVTGTNRIISALFPVLTRQFWYFSAYFFMFFFIPSFNTMIEKFSFTAMRRFLIIGFITLCFVSNIQKFFTSEIISIGQGYNLFWLSFCYLVGAFINKYFNVFLSLKKSTYILITSLCMFLTFVFNTFLYNWEIPIFQNYMPKDFFMVYTSPTVFVPSACLLILFAQMKVNGNKKILKIFSTSAFSVYIIQTQPFIWDNYLSKYSTFFANPAWYQKVTIALASSVVLYITLTLIDFIRLQLFKLIRIDKLSGLICRLFEKIFSTIKNFS